MVVPCIDDNNLIYTKSVKKIMKAYCHATVFHLRSKTKISVVVILCLRKYNMHRILELLIEFVRLSRVCTNIFIFKS